MGFPPRTLTCYWFGRKALAALADIDYTVKRGGGSSYLPMNTPRPPRDTPSTRPPPSSPIHHPLFTMKVLLAALLYALTCLTAAIPIALSTPGHLLRPAAALLSIILLPSIHRHLDHSALLSHVALWRTCLKIYSWIQALHTVNSLLLTPNSTANPSSFATGLWDAIKCNWRWREIGSRREARNTPSFPTAMVVSRVSVCRMHAVHALWCFLALDVIAVAPQPDAQRVMSLEKQHLFGRDNVTMGELGFRGGAVAGFWIANFLGLSANYSCLAVLAMVVFRADPEVWRPCFGRVRDAYTVRRFWG